MPIKTVLRQQPNSYPKYFNEGHLLPGLFGILHCNEFIVPLQRSFDLAAHLSCTDIAEDDYDNPSSVVVSIKKSKTDPFCRETSITLGTTQNKICPVKVIMLCLARRGSQVGPFFICENQHFLTQ